MKFPNPWNPLSSLRVGISRDRIHFWDPGHDKKHKDVQDGWKSTGAIGGDIPKMTSDKQVLGRMTSNLEGFLLGKLES